MDEEKEQFLPDSTKLTTVQSSVGGRQQASAVHLSLVGAASSDMSHTSEFRLSKPHE